MSSRSWRSSGSNIDALGLLTLLVLVGTGIAAWFIVQPILKPDTAADARKDRARDPEAAADKFASAIDTHTAQIEGRSLFSIPPAPKLAERDGPKATTYSGPQLIAFINNTAWFADGQKLSPDAPKAKSLELIKANPPWSVRVKWEGGEFDVELFKRVMLSTLNEPLKPGASMIPAGNAVPSANSNLPPGLPQNLIPPASAQANTLSGQTSKGNGPGADPKPESNPTPSATPQSTPAPPAPTPPPAPANQPEPHQDPAPAPAPQPPSEPSEP